jgi:ATP-dependent helicase/nuclease subunit A
LVQNAKTTVTELRRRAADELDDESRHLFGSRVIRRKTSAASGLGGAEVGAAVHKFLQHCALDAAADVTGLEAEAIRLTTQGLLADVERRAVDLATVARFWSSDCGRMIREHSPHVSREVPFTARLSAADLRAIDPKLAQEAMAAEEFVVVQGVADLMVILPAEIWLLDFKTDAVSSGGLAAKVAAYAPQLRLYALALGRIYQRPVTRCWLHFLETGATETIPT